MNFLSPLDKKNSWLIFLSLSVVLLGFLAALNLVQQKQLFQKSAQESISLIFPSSGLSVKKDKVFKVPVALNSSGHEIEGVDLKINFIESKEMIYLVDIEPLANEKTPLKTFIPLIQSNGKFNKTKVIRQANDTGIIKLGAVAFDRNEAGSGILNPFAPSDEFDLANLVFRAEKPGRAVISFCLWANNNNCGTNQVNNANKGVTSDTNIVSAGEKKDILNFVNELVVIVN